MPPAFSAEEKARITEILLESGRDLFTTRGLRKTSLEELVAPAGIAKSSFYVFFGSKEALYLELMRRQTADVRRRLVDGALLTSPHDTREALRRFLSATVRELTTNPLYGRLMSHPEEMEMVARKVTPEAVAITSEDNPATALTSFVTARRDEGAVIDADVPVILGALQSVLMFPTYRHHLADPDRADEVLDLLVDAVATALTSRKD
ncbi:TetR/AcrR family transcriptional regulator [Nocardiopsis sp. NPDC050513]|uniref:TetR/AcrR family transcriptional regulator n=1 Tax=Nocardiopsis sp. NPDC050513 TaxID=3364338 RepID=UPI00378BDEF0